jgi:2-keto-4-pentenoate hydratase/2-oxohepta-3-ene-1,7-dioic acid hydratase in catechol pathway
MDQIPVPPIAQQGHGLDYEGELVVVIGKEAYNVAEEEAQDYILGYAAGNDVSHRDWQIKRGGGHGPWEKALTGGRHSDQASSRHLCSGAPRT